MIAIATQPLRFSQVGKHVRKAQVLGWLYTVFFVINEVDSEIKVIAVWHGARNPAELRRRLK